MAKTLDCFCSTSAPGFDSTKPAWLECRSSSVTTASAIPTSPKKKRKSGPPRSYTDTPASISALHDFAAVTAPTTATIWCGILPKVLDTSDANDTLDLSEIGGVQATLKAAGLVFNVVVSATGPIFEDIELAFRDHCATNNIDYVAPSVAAATPSPNTMSYVLLGPRGRANGRTWVEDPKSLTRFTFTLQSLRSAPYSHTPNNLGDGVFIFLAPRHRNLFAPIDCLFGPTNRLPDYVLPHRCFGRRVLYSVIASLSGDPAPECGKGCTTLTTPANVEVIRQVSPEILEVPDSDDEFPAMLIDEDGPYLSDSSGESHTVPAIQPRAAFTMVTRAAARQQWQEQAAAAAVLISTVALFAAPGPLLTSIMEKAPVNVKQRSYLGVNAAVDLTLQHMPGSGAFAMAAWQNHLLMPREMDEHVTITAGSVDEGARALIVLCLWLCSRPTSVKLKELVNEQFTSPRPTIENAHLGERGLWGLRARIEQGVGRGPRNEVVARAVKILVSDGRFWTEREGYLTLCLHPSRSPIPYRFCVSKATGLIFLLHFSFIGAPLSVSPFLFYTVFDGRPLYSSTSEYCEEYQYLVNIPGVDPSMISPCRSEAEHAGISDCVVSFAQLGTVDIEHNPDYLATEDGFNVVVEAFGGQDRPHHVLELRLRLQLRLRFGPPCTDSPFIWGYPARILLSVAS
ncbi:hypothetical protein R3P38DRAFT_3453507 [Favolaschia claudopus]|uniref:Uncharacterized protein n=1 Tax=Favolaschia claudopus TaxID=2862362 RepID=A0AAW0CSQ5_9AGAR